MIGIAMAIFVILIILLIAYFNLRAGKTKSKEDMQVEKLQLEKAKNIETKEDTQVEKLQQEIELPSRELILKVKFISNTKHTVGIGAEFNVGLALRGEFNRFGLYVQEKAPFYYFAGGKHIPNLEFAMMMDLENPLFKDEKGNTFLRYQVTVRKYKPGDWEKNVDLTYKFARAFEDMVEEETERRKGPPLTELYPPDSPELAEAFDRAMKEARQKDQAIYQLVLQKLRSDTSWQYKNYELPGDDVQFVK